MTHTRAQSTTPPKSSTEIFALQRVNPPLEGVDSLWRVALYLGASRGISSSPSRGSLTLQGIFGVDSLQRTLEVHLWRDTTCCVAPEGNLGIFPLDDDV